MRQSIRITAPYTADAGQEALNPQGRLFGDFLQDTKLFAPSTFAHFHTGMHTTWTHSNGSTYRRDYVLVSKSVFALTVSTWVFPDFDTTFCHADHVPVGHHVKGLIQRSLSLHRPIIWDEAALIDPARISAFQTALATLPIPTWDVATEAHKDWYEYQLLQLGAQFFEKRRGTRHRPILSADTLQIIAMKRHFLDCARAWGIVQEQDFKDQLKPVEQAVRRAVRIDLGIFYDQLLVQLQQADGLGDQKTVFRLLTRFGRKSKRSQGSARPLPMLYKPDGALTNTFQERQQVWMDQFSAIEAGQQITRSDLSELAKQTTQNPVDLPEPESFPTTWDIQKSLRRMKRGRAPGPNGIPPALLKAGGETFARQFITLLMKCAAHSQEPLSWKGGKLHPLHKGKLHPAIPDGYRSIFVSDFTAKLYHTTLRKPLEDVWQSGLHSLQLGGRKGQGTDMAHHLLQTFWHWVTKQRKPAAIVFFDVRAAFYSVIRETLFPSNGDLTALCQILHDIGVASPEQYDTLTSVDADFALDGLSPHMLAILRDVMTDTHFIIDGLEDVCRTRRGTRPGDPIGDILYNLVMSLLLRDAKSSIASDSSLEWYGFPTICTDFTTSTVPPPQGVFDVSFVDDCAFGIHGHTNQDVADGIQHVVTAMVRAAARRGLHINFEEGKTEALWNIVGKGSKQRKAQLAADQSRLTWTDGTLQWGVRIVHAYRHLGTWLQMGHIHGKEIQHRSAMSRSTWGTLARPFYNKQYVSLHSKAKVFQATALSQFMYNAHIWTGVTAKEWEKWHNALRKPFCLMIRGKLHGVNPLHIDMDAACALAGVLPPRQALQLARLRYLKRLTQSCPDALWNLLMADQESQGSWLQACHEAFDWFRQHYDVPFAPLDNDLQTWMTLISLDSSWKGRLRRAAYSCLQYHAATAEYQVFCIRFGSRFEAVGGVLPISSQPQQDKWQCDLCDRCFPTRRGLAAHAARSHGYKRIERYFAAGPTCDACGKHYHARARLLAHLYDCPDCLETLRACFPPVSETLVDQLDAADKDYAIDMRLKGWWKTKAFVPPERIQGPLLPPPHTEDARVFLARWMLRTPSPGARFEELQGRLDTPTPDGPPNVHLFENDFPAFIMLAPPGPNKGGGALDQIGLAKETAILHIRWLVFAHFFSGFRRQEDLHQIIEQLSVEDGSQIMVIPIDLCMQKKDGSLATDSATTWWLQRVRSGQLLGAGGGPPCESYTAARFQGEGPRPLRTGTHPCGLPALNRHEWAQVRIGSRLVYFIFEIILELAAAGGCGFIEHPQWPLWAIKHDPASIWSSKQARWIKTLACCSVVSFDQCIVGAPAKKPTTLLLLRLDSLRHELLCTGHAGRCPHRAGAHEKLQGRTDQGVFRTAVGKVYPPGLNKAIGRAVCRYARATFAGELLQTSMPETFSCYQQQVFESNDVVQPDFHRVDS